MKVATRLSGGFGIVIVLLVAITAYNVRALYELAATSRHLSEVSARLHLASSELTVTLDRMDEFARKYGVTGDPAYAREFGELAGSFGSSLAGLEELAGVSGEPAGGPERTRELEELAGLWSAFRPVAEAFGGSPPTGEPARGREVRVQLAWLESLDRHARATGASLRRQMTREVEASLGEVRRAERLSWTVAGAVLLVGLVVATGTVRSIGRGIRRLAVGSQRIAAGALDHRVPATGDDEFGQVARAFNSMAERLEEVDRMKRTFFAQVSHDLKSPLASILEVHGILLDEVPGEVNEQQRRLLELGRRSGERLMEMITEILELGRVREGVAELDRERVDLRELVRETVASMEPRAERSDVQVDLDLPGDPLEAGVDRRLVQRMLANLLENAVSFSPAGEHVAVACAGGRQPPAGVPAARWSAVADARGEGTGVILTVTDAGPGIPDARKERVFEAFHSRGGDGREAGMGLGLALCRRVAEAHGGTIWVEDAPGGGSRFRVLLPVGWDPSGRDPEAAGAG